MDNMAIQIVGNSKKDVGVCIQKLFNNLSLPQQEIKIAEQSQISTNGKEGQAFCTLKSNLYFVGVENIDIAVMKEISKEQQCKIFVNFEYKTFSDDIVFNSGDVRFGTLPEEYQMFSA